MLLPIPLPSGHAIVISWSPSSSSPSHKGLVPKMQPAPPAPPPTGLVSMLQPEPYFPLTLSLSFFEYIYIEYIYIYMCVCVSIYVCVCVCVSVYIYKLHQCLIYFLFIFWPHHSSCRTLVPRPGIELTPPAVDLNHWTAREVPFPTHHHPLCFLEAHSQIILENGHLQWNYT